MHWEGPLKGPFRGWRSVGSALEKQARTAPKARLNDGQRASLRAIAERLPRNGVLIADEVGMGKTRIAVEVARAVTGCGGRVAILVPPGLGYQWQAELRDGGIPASRGLLRTLRGFLQAWSSNDPAMQEAWFKDEVVLISHAFTNWRFGERSHSWRWSLLPLVYSFARKELQGRRPWDFRNKEELRDPWVLNAANSICEHASRRGHPGRPKLWELIEKTPWPGALEANEYKNNESLRPLLEQAVGLGLGFFDLVIVDEAHKSRGGESGLSRLLADVLQFSGDSRRVAMTATPVELDEAQWEQTLQRVGLSTDQLNRIHPVIKAYAERVRELRNAWRSSEPARASYKAAADRFKKALDPYLLRRDKREDPSVQRFAHMTGRSLHEYRCESEVSVNKLSAQWKMAVCAAEALSVVAPHAQDPIAKRLRLTLGNGHGIAALLDQSKADDVLDQRQHEHDAESAEPDHIDRGEDDSALRRQARGKWWRSVIEQAFATDKDGDGFLLGHPAILAAVEAIEEKTRMGEKVLVFGRFTRPLRALVELVNAREMLRCVDEGRAWPQARVHGRRSDPLDRSDWPAVRAAHGQLKNRVSLNDLNRRLARRYDAERRRRERLRDMLLGLLDQGLAELQADQRAIALLAALKISAKRKASRTDEKHPLTLVTRALSELLSGSTAAPQPRDWGQAFLEMIEAVTDRDEGDGDGDGQLDEAEAYELWRAVEERLHEEYNRPQGGYARLMYGATRQDTRRMIQLAFNRPKSFPYVLVAQSVVGREGLNLHKACRNVLLLHPEWNPGVVEQQIGRVDRVGSQWAQMIDGWSGRGEAPQIQIQPVVFPGTYDEHNWQVLRSRWDDYRAQLHGIVVPPRLAEGNREDQQLLRELEAWAPSFSPNRNERRRRASG